MSAATISTRSLGKLVEHFNAATLLLALLVANVSGHVIAAQEKADGSELNAPIEIEADTAEQNETKGLITYKGNVLITQAGLQISADRVSIQSTKSGEDSRRLLRHIVAVGQPARFVHEGLADEGTVTAEANKIFFEVDKRLLSLTNNARLLQNRSKVSGDKIEYLIEQRRVRARSFDPDSGNRVHTVISSSDDTLLPALE